MNPEPLALEPYPLVDLRSDLGEFLIDDERALVLNSMESVEKLIHTRARDKNNLGRGDHAKGLGCYHAEFTVSSGDVVPPDFRVGIARSENLGRTFRAIVRLSNSEPKNVPDFRSATVGLAVKIRLDPGTHSSDDFLPGSSGEQNFIAGGLRTFVARNIQDYAELFRLRVHPVSNLLALASRHAKALAVFAAEPLLRHARGAGAAPMVLESQFSSVLPYAWGDSAVKFRFEPCHAFDRSNAVFSRFDPGYQRKVVTTFLGATDICYVMKIQPRPRFIGDQQRRAIERTFPIEDAMVSWPEPEAAKDTASAAFHEVARLTIKRGSEAMDDRACEHLAFNPWHGLKVHQPLGSLNRARLAVYRKSELVRKAIYQTMPALRL